MTDDINAADLCRDIIRECTQGSIACGVAVSVVERFEVVDVYEQQATRTSIAIAPLNLAIEPFGYRAVIGYAGQRVGRRQSEQACVGRFDGAQQKA